MRAILVAMAAAGVALADEVAESQGKEIEAIRPRLAGPLRVAEAQAIREALPGFAVEDLRRIENHPAFGKLTEVEQGFLLHAIRAAVFAADHERDLEDPWPSGFLLGSPIWTDWLEACRLLLKEPFDAGLERVAVALSNDPRPQVRVGAGRLAKALTLFRGPSPECAAIAKRLLADPVPNVVMLFGTYDASDFRDKEVTDAAVACLKDRRRIESIPGIAPCGPGGTVAASIASRLQGEIGMAGAHPKPGAIEAWWRQNRDAYDYGLDPARWQLVGEWKGTCGKGEEVEIPVKGGRVYFTVLGYEEYRGVQERPVNDVMVRLRAEGQAPGDAPRIGSKQCEDVERGLGGGGAFSDGWQLERFVVPDREGNFRVAVRVWAAAKLKG